jgi:outer membrane receptor for ferrienterochelin and colicins
VGIESRPGPFALAVIVATAALALAGSAWAAPSGDPGSDKSGRFDDPLIEQLDLQTLLNTPIDVWTPSKAPQKSYEAPAIVTTVTREQIAVWGHRSLGELLGHLLGFYVVDDHASTNVVVRGTSGGLYSDSSVIKVLIDGHPVAFSPTGGVGLGPELIPLSAIERIEIIRGPASSLYGADAFLGLVNIQTRAPDSAPRALAQLTIGEVGDQLATDVDAQIAGRAGWVEALLAVRQNHQDLSGLGLPDSSPAPNIPGFNRGVRAASGLDQSATSALATVTARPRPGRTIGLFGYHSALDRGSEFGSLFQLAHGLDGRGVLSENRVSHWQARGGLTWSEVITPRLQLSLRAAYFHGRTRDDNRIEVGSDFYYVRRRLGFRGGDLDVHVEWTPASRLVLAAGSGALVDDERLPARIAVAKQPIGDVGPGEIIPATSAYQGRKTFLNLGAYLQATWQPFDDDGSASWRAWGLGITGGLRYDHHNIYGGQLSRRLGLVGSPRSNLHVKLLHGSAFQAPSPFLLYAIPAATGDVVGNPQLRPQYVNTFEFQIEYAPTAVLGLSTALAYNRLDDKTEFIQQGINLVARNLARTTTVSWENKAELKYRDWLNGHLSFEVQRTRVDGGQQGYAADLIGNEGSLYPRMMIHAGAAAQLGPLPARLAVLASYIGTRRASGTNILLNAGDYHLPPYVLLEANLGSRTWHVLGSDLSFALSGKNLLDASGPMPGLSGVDYPLVPRRFFLQLNVGL